MLTTYAVLSSWNFFYAGTADWDPTLAGLDDWWEETHIPTRWCAGLPSWVPASAQSVFGATLVLGSDRPVTMNLIFPERYPRFSSNPMRSFSPECLELLLQEAEVEEEGGNADGCLEERERGEVDDEPFDDSLDVAELLPRYYREKFLSGGRTR